MSGLFPPLLATHVALAIALLVPSLLLPFVLRGQDGHATHRAPTRGLLWLQSHGTVVIGAGVAATGLALLALLGPSTLTQPWLLLAIAVYAANLLAAFFVQRPNLRRLVGLSASTSDAERARWRSVARRQRYMSYLMAGAIALIAFLMSTKPTIW